MLDRLLGFKIHDYLQALGLFILAFGVPMNKVLMSIGTIWLASNLLLKADFKIYWRNWKYNGVFWFVVLVLVLHLIGLIYTENLAYAFHDLKVKLPLFVIPVALIGYPIEKKYFNIILYGFLLSLLITSTINLVYMMNNQAEDYRNFSLFGSHIRYALLVITGILVAVYLWINNSRLGLLYCILSLGFVFYTLISQVLSGYVALVFLAIGFLIFFIQKIQKKRWRRFIISVILIFVFLGSYQAYIYLKPNTQSVAFGDLPEKTLFGELYYHDTTSLRFDNGHHIMSYISEKELAAEWNKRSNIDLDTKTKDGYLLKMILIRYMSSKGLTKDKEGMSLMTEQDIKNVESGIPSVTYSYSILHRKLVGLKDEIFHYSIGGDPDGSSLLQRIEHWKAGMSLIKNNWLIGVGTGDVQKEFELQYSKSNTQLDTHNWKRAHNQFLTFWITFGIVGFIVFTGFWLWYLWKNIQSGNLIGIGFTLIAIASFLSEDTLETQQGITYISLFLGLSVMLNDSYSIEKKDT